MCEASTSAAHLDNREALAQRLPALLHDLLSDRGAWRRMLESGIAPAAFRPQARPPSPRIARTKPTRSCARATVLHGSEVPFPRMVGRVVLHGISSDGRPNCVTRVFVI